jgi:hypothetical protein
VQVWWGVKSVVEHKTTHIHGVIKDSTLFIPFQSGKPPSLTVAMCVSQKRMND